MSIVDKFLNRTENFLDKAVCAISPEHGLRRLHHKNKLQICANAGFDVPGSIKKSMKGVTATANSPDRDIIQKLPGMRGLSRDMHMNSPLVTTVFRRHRTLKFGSGLQVQAVIDRNYLGLDSEEARQYEVSFEREFDLWAESFNSDYDGINFYGDNQGLGYLSMLMNGDYFWMPVWRKAPERDFPYELCIKFIESDLVYSPMDHISRDRDIKGGVEKDSKGQIVAYYVWDAYQNDLNRFGRPPTYMRVPVFNTLGERQIYHVYHPERFSQRRGTPLFANSAALLKQITRASDAKVMETLVAAYFTVFVKDASGMGAMLGPALTPEETVTGGGRYGPNEPEASEQYSEDGNDLEMGYGNVTYLDDKKDIVIASADKTDKGFEKFWESMGRLATASGDMPFERALMHYTSSYTAAKAMSNDDWRHAISARTLINRKQNQQVYTEFFVEALLKGRISAPRFFDDYSYKRAWTRSHWVGIGQGSLDPLREAKASVINLNSYLANREEEYAQKTGGRWDSSVERRAREQETLLNLGLKDQPDKTELIGPDGQQDEEQNA